MTEQYPETAHAPSEEAVAGAIGGTDFAGAVEPETRVAMAPVPPVSHTARRFDDGNVIAPGTSSAGLPTVPWLEPE